MQLLPGCCSIQDGKLIKHTNTQQHNTKRNNIQRPSRRKYFTVALLSSQLSNPRHRTPLALRLKSVLPACYADLNKLLAEHCCTPPMGATSRTIGMALEACRAFIIRHHHAASLN
jgi:hypothetical protein